MTSPSDAASDITLPGMPARLPNGGARPVKVSRLRFHALEHAANDSLQDADSRPRPAEEEASLRREIADLKEQLQAHAQQIVAEVEAAEWRARAAARRDWEEELDSRLALERARVSHACHGFAKQRVDYFAEVEKEVVKLALAIAVRILHREAKLDPLLLTAAVRVALEKVSDSSTAILRVPPAEMEGWQKMFAAATRPVVALVEDENLHSGDCILETQVGQVELGVSAQLEEIERGFFDLLEQRPT
ncbi:MAG TPA: FliH/SctL family protein [Edaphobacter sp.]|nr:FliH/SctL family protein [Edaphobacter sp.]